MKTADVKQCVLIIDDAIANIKILRETLAPENTILFAQNASDGIGSAIKNQPDLILLDIMMPDMDGYQVCRVLKEDDRTRTIPIIFITAKADEDDEAKGFEAGAVDYITKPFLPVITRARVHTHLKLRANAIALKNLSDQQEQQKIALASANVVLEALRNEATQKLHSRSRFFQEASHDFKQRLHAIQLLVQAAKTGTQAETAKYLSKVADATASIKEYVADFLEFTQLETSSSQVNLVPVNLQDLFQNLAIEFENVAFEKNIDLRIRTTHCSVTTDSKLMYRILENIVSNAIKFSRGRVLVAARKSKSTLLIEIWDNGPGIPPEKRELVFDAFYKEDLDGMYQDGVGLGLSIVKRLATILGYAVTINSVAGKLNVFRIYMPLHVAK